MQQYADIYSLQSSFAVNKYLHTVAFVGFLFTLNYDARNYELKNTTSVQVPLSAYFFMCAFKICLQMMVIIKTEMLMFY